MNILANSGVLKSHHAFLRGLFSHNLMMRGLMTRGLMIGSLLLISAVSWAHSPVVRTLPETNAVLNNAPSSAEIEFKSAVLLTSAQLGMPDTAAVKLTVTPQTKATSFQFSLPTLGAGKYRIDWKALSDDGHVMSGQFEFEVRPIEVQLSEPHSSEPH